MKNEEYGISTIKLIFTVLILAIIISGIVFIVKGLWQHSNVKDVETDLLYIKAKCKIIHDKNIIDENEKLLGESLTEYVENEEVNKIISQSDKWYKLGQQDLQAMGLEDLKHEDGYLVNYEEQDIIYAKGIERYKQTYYKLSDLEKAEEEEEARKQEEEKAKQEKEEETIKEEEKQKLIKPNNKNLQ